MSLSTPGLLTLCAVLSVGSGVGSALVFRPRPAEPAKPFELPKSFRGERFEVVDAAGKPRAWIALGKDGAPEAAVADEDGRPRAALTLGPGGPLVELRDAQGQVRASMAVAADGTRVTLRTPDRDALVLRANPDGSATVEAGADRGAVIASGPGAKATLHLNAPDGTPRAVLAATDAGGALDLRDGDGARKVEANGRRVTVPELRVADATGATRASIEVAADRGAELRLTPPGAPPRVQIGESGTILLNDAEGRTRCELAASTDAGGAVTLRDATGTLRARLAAAAAGQGSLVLNGNQDHPVVILEERSDSTPSLRLCDAKTGTARAWLDTAAEDVVTFGLYDRAGTNRFSLLLNEVGCPSSIFSDDEGRIRFLTGVNAEGDAGLEVRDLQGRNLIRLAATPQLDSSLSFTDRAGKLRGWFGILDTGAAAISLCDAEGRVRSQGAIFPDGGGYIGLRDAEGDPRVYLAADTTGRPDVNLWDSANVLRASLYLSVTDSAQLRFNDRSANERIWLGFDSDNGASLSFFDTQKVTRCWLGVMSTGYTGVTFSDSLRARLLFGLVDGTLPVANFKDNAGKDRVQFGLLPTQEGRINVLNGTDSVIWNAP